MNKRTLILKQITSEKILDTKQSISIDAVDSPASTTNIQEEGLLEKIVSEQIPIIAKQLKTQERHLQSWLEKYQNAAAASLITLFRLVERYSLDPLLEEVDLVQYEDQSWQAVITPQGYTRLMNACPQFRGISYAYSEANESAIPAWIECTIYRCDRDDPITVREYYVEVKRDSPIWQKMPRRMLRNRAFQQCAKLALGI